MATAIFADLNAGQRYFGAVGSLDINDLFLTVDNPFGQRADFQLASSGNAYFFTPNVSGTHTFGVSSNSFVQRGTYAFFGQATITQNLPLVVGTTGNDTHEATAPVEVWGWDGDDRLLGSSGDDVLVGGRGHDGLSGRGGNDLLIGEDGNDVMDGGDGDDHVQGGLGDDWLVGGGGSDSVFGGGGNDYIDGGDGNDLVVGEAGFDFVLGGAGNDVMDGGSENDIMDGGDGQDIIGGGSGNDIIGGGAGSDYVFGAEGDDYIDASTGEDLVYGAQGSDTLFGGPDSDVFYYIAGHGTDVIRDFVPGSQADVIDLIGTEFGSFAQVQSRLSFYAAGNATVLSFSSGAQILIAGVQPHQLDASDFWFNVI